MLSPMLSQGTAAMFVKLSPLSGLFIMEVRCLVQWVISCACIVAWRRMYPNAEWTMLEMFIGNNQVPVLLQTRVLA